MTDFKCVKVRQLTKRTLSNGEVKEYFGITIPEDFVDNFRNQEVILRKIDDKTIVLTKSGADIG